jgi:dipeptide/tripeptide permease
LTAPEQLTTPEPFSESEEDAFSADVFRRIVRTMVILAVAVTPLLWLKYHRALALGFAAGCAIALINFYWLKRMVAALVDAVARQGKKRSAAGVVFTFITRYILIAVVAYVIVKGSEASVYGLFVGLSLPVGAILIEAVYVTYGAVRRGF